MAIIFAMVLAIAASLSSARVQTINADLDGGSREYSSSDAGHICSETGRIPVEDLKDCKNAVTWIQLQYLGISDVVKVDLSGSFPRGCAVYVKEDYEGIYFNTHSSGNPETDSRQVCKAEAIDTKPPTERSTPPRTDATTNPPWDVKISLVGVGFCRPSGCDITDSTCRVNGYYKDGFNYLQCSTACLNDISCVGFAVSSEKYVYLTNNRCWVYGNISQSYTEWTKSDYQYYDVQKASNTKDVACYKISSECVDSIPSTCTLPNHITTCSDLGSYCDDRWSDNPACASTPGLIKDNCKATCGICHGTSSSASIAAITTPPGRTVALTTSADICSTYTVYKVDKACESNGDGRSYNSDGNLNACIQYNMEKGNRFVVWYKEHCYGSNVCNRPHRLSGTISYDINSCTGTSSSATAAATTTPPRSTVALTTSAGICSTYTVYKVDEACESNEDGRSYNSDGNLNACIQYNMEKGNRFVVWYDEECYGSNVCNRPYELSGTISYDIHSCTGTSSSATAEGTTIPPRRNVALTTSAGSGSSGMEECWYDYIGLKEVKSCKDDTRIPDTEIMDRCSNMHCRGNNPKCAPTCTGCKTKVEFCGQGSFVNNYNEYDYNTLDYDGNGGNEFNGSGEFEDIGSGILTSTEATVLQTTETIQSTQANIPVLQSSSCRDQKIWCNLANCSLENVKRNCKKTCNIC